MRTFTRLSIAGVVALGAAVIPVTMASAETPAPASTTQHVTPNSAGDVALTWPAGTFVPGSDVTVLYKGAQGAPIVTTTGGAASSIKSTAANITLIDVGDAAADGSLAVTLQFTADATGAYQLSFGDEAGHSVVADVQTSQPASKTVGAPNTSTGGGSVSMGYLSLLVVWAAIGLAALTAGYVVVRVTERRQHALRVEDAAAGAGAGAPGAGAASSGVGAGIPQPVSAP